MKVKKEKLNMANIEYKMQQKNLTWIELAKACNVSKTTANKWHLNKFTPNYEKRKKMSTFLEIPMKSLIIPIDKEEYIDTQDTLPFNDSMVDYNSIPPYKAVLLYLLACAEFEGYMAANKQQFDRDDYRQITYYTHMLRQRVKKMTLSDNTLNKAD